MTGQDLIDGLELYTDDTTELSTAEELALLNVWYHTLCDDRPWEILKKEFSNAMASTTTITVPADFGSMLDNRLETDNSSPIDYNARPVGILVNGVKWLQMVNWSDRRQYANRDGYAYLDIANNLIRTTYAQPSGATVSFDYKRVPDDITLATEPVFPARFHPIIYRYAAADDMIIQLFDKARSCRAENLAVAATFKSRMDLWNANLQND